MTETQAPEALPETLPAPPHPYPQRILLALWLTGRHVYGGTVPAKVKARRRAANRVARASRRANR